MKRLFVFAAVLLLVGAGCALPFAGKGPQATGPIRCEYEGKSYDLGAQRRAADSCNVCTCGRTGWECTELRCAAGASLGTIRGTLSFPSEDLPPLMVCAAPREGEPFCTQTIEGQSSYSLLVPEGRYVVYVDESNRTGIRAYWSEAVKCGLSADCKDHSPIEIEVRADQEAAADPQDWYASTVIDGVTVTPSRRLDKAFFLKRGAVITVRGRGLADVELSYLTYPPGENAVTKPLGKALLQVTEESGAQKWIFPVPPGLEATDVTVAGTGAEGQIFRWRGLGYFRWGDVPPTEEESAWMKP